MSNNNESSVEWYSKESLNLKVKLENKKISIGEYAVTYFDLLRQAKARHKEECINLLNTHNDIDDTSEDHYNKTFGGNDEQ